MSKTVTLPFTPEEYVTGNINSKPSPHSLEEIKAAYDGYHPSLETEAVKFDGDKVRMELIPPELLTAVGTVLTFGAEKYAARNWELGMDWSRVYGALLRHLNAWMAGEAADPETGYSHLWHAACCITFLLSFEMRGSGTDDRPSAPQKIEQKADIIGSRVDVVILDELNVQTEEPDFVDPAIYIDEIAKIAHETNRAYCGTIEDGDRQPMWEDAPDWQKESAHIGVWNVLQNPTMTPEQSHEGWLKVKKGEGWKYGKVKDPEKKTHPCMMPYEYLPEEQKIKDVLFTSTVRGQLEARGLI